MNTITPSTNRNELLTQLYVFRGMLGQVYVCAESCENYKKQVADATGNLEQIEDELQSCKFQVLQDIHRRKISNYKNADECKNKINTLQSKAFAVKMRIEGLNKSMERYRTTFVERKDALKKMFGSFLFESDWNRIDTLIYLVASGRADSLKEALNGSDVIIRHDEVVGKLTEIKNSIYRQTQMMSECTRALLLGMNEINKSIKEVGSKIDSLNDCIMIATASINETINTSSREMCERIGRVSNQLYRMR